MSRLLTIGCRPDYERERFERRKVLGLCPILLQCQCPGASTSWRVNPVWCEPWLDRYEACSTGASTWSASRTFRNPGPDRDGGPPERAGRPAPAGAAPAPVGAGWQGATVPPPAHRAPS